MDGTRFDDVARRFGRMLDRRRVLAAIAAIGAAGVAGVDDVGAAPRRTCRPVAASCLRNRDCCSGICETRRTAPRNRRNRCVCPAGELACGMECVDPSSNKNHCGACGNVCPGTCVSGVCTCQGVTCTVDEAGGWEQCGIDNETCQVIDACTLPEDVDLDERSCQTHADCADYSDLCGVDGHECRCIAGASNLGSYVELDQSMCAVFASQDAPGICTLVCTPTTWDSCFVTTSGAVIQACAWNLSFNNATVDPPTGTNVNTSCETDADCSQQCNPLSDACHCTYGGIWDNDSFTTWSDLIHVFKACVAVDNVTCE